MGTPKEKADKLIEKFSDYCNGCDYNMKMAKANAKECALIYVNDMIEWDTDFDVYFQTDPDWWKDVRDCINAT